VRRSDRDHRRRHRVVGRQDELPASRNCSARVWGANFLRGEHRRRSPPLPRATRPHVRRPQPCQSRRRPTRCSSADIRVPRSFPRSRASLRRTRRSSTWSSTPTRCEELPVDAGIVADPKATLALFADELGAHAHDEQREAQAGAPATWRRRSEATLRARGAHGRSARRTDASIRVHAELARRRPTTSSSSTRALTSSPELTTTPANLPGHTSHRRALARGRLPGCARSSWPCGQNGDRLLGRRWRDVHDQACDGGAPLDRREVRRCNNRSYQCSS